MEKKPKTILIADDDENLRTLYAEDLRDEGYQVILAQNGKEAIDFAERIPIDLIILDIIHHARDGRDGGVWGESSDGIKIFLSFFTLRIPITRMTS